MAYPRQPAGHAPSLLRDSSHPRSLVLPRIGFHALRRNEKNTPRAVTITTSIYLAYQHHEDRGYYNRYLDPQRHLDKGQMLAPIPDLTLKNIDRVLHTSLLIVNKQIWALNYHT